MKDGTYPSKLIQSFTDKLVLKFKKDLKRELIKKDKRYKLIEVIEKVIKPCAYQETGLIIYNEILILQEGIMKKNLIEDKWYTHPRKLQAQEIIFLTHVYVGSHLSIKRTTEQVPESGYRWENMDSDISKMISKCEICGAKRSKPKKLRQSISKIIELRRDIKKIQFFY